MGDREWFGGKVRVDSLPAFEPGGARADVMLKRLMLTQGELAQFHNGEPSMRYVAAIELKAATCRGNHYHRKKKEWFYVVSGSLIMAVQDIEAAAPEFVPLQAGDLIVIGPGVGHAFHVKANGFAVECSPDPFEPADTFPFPMPAP